MPSLPPLRSLLSDDGWKYALIGGLVALPFTAAVYRRTGSRIGLGPAFVGGLIAGYLHDGFANERARIGAVSGVIGALPALWVLGELLSFITLETGSPGWFRAVSVALAIGVIATVFVLAAGVAAISARVGDWASSKAGRTRPPTAAH
ncbi:DUF5518 domain-containing protein [Haloterrigena salifodinae]|uniref:DUF5518 domain-containing protein n=1 Tax=Haloterrigena salifodinae TaxID=2675099 RepID=A0A8T8E435_9EURY|nr:DUF5518 domain-containing protein [Haloterrigena salifodinae]QRV16252.1 DUF5518 domain-containing protein [Haloterrigena salifodinae]